MRVLKKLNLEDVLFIDIETSTVVPELQLDTPLFDSWKYKMKGGDNEEVIASYKKEAALYADFGRIVCISVGRLYKGDFVTTTFNDFDETEMLKKFFAVLDKGDWILCGHAVKSFDIPYIFQRSIINGLFPHELIDTSGLKPWEMTGIIDTKELWSAGGFNKSGLVNITTALGLPSPKTGITGAQVPAYFWEDPKGHIQEISEYCERDVVAVYDVMKRFKNPEDKPIEQPPLIKHLFDGGKYDEEHKNKLVGFISSLTETEQINTFVILESLTSTASGKRTKFTKAHVKELKQLCNA